MRRYLLLSLFFISSVIISLAKPKYSLPDKDGSPIPTFLSLPIKPSPKVPEVYKFDEKTNIWKAQTFYFPLIEDAEKIQAMSFDPIKFKITSNKNQIKINEELELTVTAELLDVSPSLMFTFEGSNEYTLKVITPKGFIITGGNYYNYARGKLNKESPKDTYTIKGYFESDSDNCFTILRGNYVADANSIFVKKETFCQKFFEIHELAFEKLNTSVETNSKGTNLFQCEDLDIQVNMGVTYGGPPYNLKPKTYPNSLKPKEINVFISYPSRLFQFVLGSITEISGPVFLLKQSSNGTIQNLNITPNFTYNYDGYKNLVYAKIILPESIVWNDGDILKISGSSSTFTNIGIKVNRPWPFSNLNCASINVTFHNTDFICSYYSPPTPQISGISKICDGASTILSESGNPNFTIRWHDVNLGIVSTSNTISVNYAGTFQVGNKATNSCETWSSNFTVTKTPVFTSNLTANKTTINAGETVQLNSGCVSPSSSTWNPSSNNSTAATVSFSPTVTTTYAVACVNNGCTGPPDYITITVNPTQCTKPQPPTIGGTSQITRGATVSLTASNCSGTITWGPVNSVVTTGTVLTVTPLSTTIYSATCTVNACLSFETNFTINVTEPPNAPSPPTISANKTTITDGSNENVTLTATGCAGGAITWSNAATGFTINVSPNLTTTYYATCTLNGLLSAASNNQIITVNGPCTGASAPIITTDTYEIIPGESAALNATGCGGTVDWFLNGNPKGNPGQELRATLPGTYKAKCTNDCAASGFSNEITIALLGLRITNDLPAPEAFQLQEYFLKAEGCGQGSYVVWELPASQGASLIYFTNPLKVTGPGVYKAICILAENENISSGWQSTTINLKASDSPILTSNADGCAFANQSTLLTATGCANASFYWYDGSTNPAPGPAYRNVLPGTYWVKCCSGTQCGSPTYIEVCLNQPETIEITANKTEANFNEQILFAATGCNYGYIGWRGPNGQDISGRNVTMYGPGKYQARCYYNDISFGPWVDLTIDVKAPGALTLTSLKESVKENEPNTIVAVGCFNGTVVWQYPGLSGTLVATYGRSIDVIGPGTYTARCISYGVSGPAASLTVPLTAGNKPAVFTDKTKARPGEPVKVMLSDCINNAYWFKIIYPNGSTAIDFEANYTVLGPFKYEAGCINGSTQGIDGGVVKGEVGLAAVDYIQVVSNKSRVFPTEDILLTAYGCDLGRVEWLIGTTLISDPVISFTSIPHFGHGYYKARCIGDYTKNNEWVQVYVEPAAVIGAILTGPNRICPGTSITVFGSNCPADHYYQYAESEKEYFLGQDITVRIPQTLKARCWKNDGSWASPWTDFVIEPAFPAAFKAVSNSPVPLGGELRLTATNLNLPSTSNLGSSVATYLWAAPAGVTLPAGTVMAVRDLIIPNMSPAYNGTYTLTATFDGCVMVQEVLVNSNTCENLTIRASNKETGLESTRLTPNGVLAGKRIFKPHILTVQTTEGQSLPNAQYLWAFPPAYVAPGLASFTSPSVETALIGKYTVDVSIGNSTCPLSVDLGAEQCTPIPDDYICGTTPSILTPSTTGGILIDLARDDVFTAADYNVNVTEITSGNAQSGYMGRGYIGFNLINPVDGNAPVALGIEVTLENVKINDCYQLVGGQVKTVFDPTWSGLIDLNNLFLLGKKIKSDIADLLNLINSFDGSSNQKTEITKKINDLSALNTNLINQPNLSSTDILGLTTALTKLTTNATCKLNATSGARLNGQSCDPESLESDASTLILNITNAYNAQCAVPKTNSLYDYSVHDFEEDYNLIFDKLSGDASKLHKNECGQYLPIKEIKYKDTYSRAQVTITKTTLKIVVPKNKVKISSLFANEIELYQSIFLKLAFKDCSGNIFENVETYYLDKEYLEKHTEAVEWLYSTTSPNGNYGAAWEQMKLNLIDRLFNGDTQSQNGAVAALKRDPTVRTLNFINLIIIAILDPTTTGESLILSKVANYASKSSTRISARLLTYFGNKIIDVGWSKTVNTVNNIILTKINALKNLYPGAKIGYRGSLATGKKFGTPLPFNVKDWDVDAFIVNDNLATQIGGYGFRNARDIPSIFNIADDIETSLKNISGYRTSLTKPFTFRVFTEAEFNKLPKDYKLYQ